MDLFQLGQRLLLDLPVSNSTFKPSFNTTFGNDFLPDLPIKMLESFVPGYSTASRFLLQYFGIDISLYVTTIAFLYAANKARRFLTSKISDGFREYCTSNVHIDGDDDLYDLVIGWISETRPDVSSRSILAKTPYGSAVDDEQKDSKAFLEAALDEDGLFNFSRASARVPPQFEPYHGSHYLWHTWTGIFLVSRTKSRFLSEDSRNDRMVEELDIRCVGRTTIPIKKLLAEIKLWNVNKQISRTEIRSPDFAWYRRPWVKTSERPCRPINTVILDREQKARIVEDMNEFLHPLSAGWFATRGIPYRRGYLFHGPPGTGKTSLSFALAGLFGLGIYIIPLMDPDLTEAYLVHLFNSLPRRCIVLLEDIDSAGVEKREEDSEDEDEDEDDDDGFEPIGEIKKEKKGGNDSAAQEEDKEGTKLTNGEKQNSTTNGETNGVATTVNSKEDVRNGNKTEGENKDTIQTDKDEKPADPQQLTLTDLAKVMLSISDASSKHQYRHHEGRLYRRHRRNDQSQQHASEKRVSNISLSGLLNAIDGVATHEGRVLVMTTNHPEKLDPALIRAGRVDMQAKFTYATRLQIKYLFTRMYQHDVDLAQSCSNKKKKSTTTTSFPPSKKSEDSESNDGGDGDVSSNSSSSSSSINLSQTQLDTIAQEFANQLPEETFAPSDIQGYLLLHKRSPRTALEGVGAWKIKRLEEIAASGKVKEKARRKKKRAAA